jgi:hypothetical protein
MHGVRAQTGLLIAAIAAAVLAIAVFQPWYGLSLTPTGAAAVQQELATVAQQYGNAALQAQVKSVGAKYDALVGKTIVTIDARRASSRGSTILLALAGIALLASLLRLVDAGGLLYASGRQIALVGALAALAVLAGAVIPPVKEAYMSISLAWGFWLALLSTGAILAGGIIAGDGRSRLRPRQMRGPGPPAINREVASPLVMFREPKR